MDDNELLRYSRHVLLPELGIDAQQRFGTAHVLVVGVGGLGNPAAHFLAAAGIGTLTLVDADHVDLTNLQRQILFETASVGQRKVDAASARIAAINPEVRVVRVPVRVGAGRDPPAGRRCRRRSRLFGQLRDATRGQSRVCIVSKAVGFGRCDTF